MARAGSPDDLAAEVARVLGATSKAIPEALKSVLRAAGAVARDELRRTAPIVPGPDRMFSRWPGSGRLSVSTRLEAGLSSDRASLKVAPVGPWGVAEKGAAPHLIRRSQWMHPGTRVSQGRQSWTVGREATFRRLEAEALERAGDMVESAFEGA